MDHISIVDVACQTIISIKCVEPPPAPVVETMIKYVFPALEHVPFSLSLKVAGECYEPYEPHLSQAPHSIFLHRPGDVTADVDRGSRVFCEMIKSRAGTSHKYKSHKRSGASTPNSSVSNVCDLGDAVTEVLNNWDARDGIQSAMRDCCLQRDQVCVITGIVTAAHIECAHILKPAYAMTWFSQDSRWDKYCANFPIVAGRSSPAMDVRNGVMMSKSLRAAFDNFEFSIYPEGDQFKVFAFSKGVLAFAKHGAAVLTPKHDDRYSIPTYFADLFPHKAVFMEHFRQAVLYNAKGAADFLEYSDFDDYGGADAMEFYKEMSDPADEPSTDPN